MAITKPKPLLATDARWRIHHHAAAETIAEAKTLGVSKLLERAIAVSPNSPQKLKPQLFLK